MKKRNRRKPRRYPLLSLRRGVILYGIILVICLVFTQALYSSVSGVVFVFALLFPIGDLLLLALSFRAVAVEIVETRTTAVRGERLSFAIRTSNRGWLPLSQCDAVLSLPKCGEQGCQWVRTSVMLPSFGACRADFEVVFETRGLYRIGVEEIYLSDFLHLIRVRKRIQQHTEVRVIPRRLTAYGVFLAAEGTLASVDSIERHAHADYGDIRDYRAGDFMKSIHWKLSTKTEELQVRKRTSDTGRTTVIVCDLYNNRDNPFGFSPRALLESDDRVTEEVLAAACEASYRGTDGQLLTVGNGTSRIDRFLDIKTAEALVKPLSEATGAVSSEMLCRLMETLKLSEGVTVLYVTAFLSSACEETLVQAFHETSGATFCVCLCDCKALLPKEKHESYDEERDALCHRLAVRGIPVTVPHRKEEVG